MTVFPMQETTRLLHHRIRCRRVIIWDEDRTTFAEKGIVGLNGKDLLFAHDSFSSQAVNNSVLLDTLFENGC